MPNSGSGTGHIITTPVGAGGGPSLYLPQPYPNCAISLTRYAQWVAYDEAAFWGVTYDGQEDLSCNVLWQEQQRMELARALAEAQVLMEDVIGYPLCPKWITENQPYHHNPFMTKLGRLIEMGKAAISDIALSEPVGFLSEPATIGPLPTTVTNASEIHVYLQGTEREVIPSKVTLAGGFLSLEIPRSRLVLPTYDTRNDWIGNRFTDLVNFAGEVDIKRLYTDTSQTATILSKTVHCGIETTGACVRVENPGVGVVRVHRLSCLRSVVDCERPAFALELYYKAGLATLDPKVESALIRLAHTLVPETICKGCDQIHRLWEKDTKIPPVATRERINCPFGLSDGAWMAYKKAQSMKLYRISEL